MLQLAVAKWGDGWCVFRDGQVVERDLSRSAAIEKVQSLALAEATLGREVQTLISSHTGLLDKRYYGGGAEA